MNNLRDLIPVFSDGDQNVIQSIELSKCILKLTAEYSNQYIYPKDIKTIKYCYQRTMDTYEVPLAQMDAGSMEAVSDKEIAGIRACTRGKQKIIRHASVTVFYSGTTTEERSSVESCFEIRFPADMDVAQKIKKSLKNLIDMCR